MTSGLAVGLNGPKRVLYRQASKDALKILSLASPALRLVNEQKIKQFWLPLTRELDFAKQKTEGEKK